MTGPDRYTTPELATERTQARKVAKKFNAYREKHGTCSVCKHRSKAKVFDQFSVCVIGDMRTHPDCEKDGKGLRYELDDSMIDQFRDKAA